MTLRKYWQRHPIQLRATALFLLVFLPILLPLLAAIMADWRGIARDVAEHYRDAWRALTKGH
ncbi:hypothetical protein AWB80_08464 [Caballeronia pedi]|uniref:Uncharacterized protein n=1 Tax=Caballeronia pedi TaxID=1777141 RepID=A0A158E7P1_9BURK|nr:hypothetical protein [Caballeronia pedi]SAL02895.1 hypothetical protein AWB80_08464 [Caballeronia pedi]